jgi:hypothetical protein
MRCFSHARAIALVLVVSSPIVLPGQPAPLAPGEFTGSKPSNVVTWQTKRLTPPSPLYVTVDDVLRVGGASSQAGESVTVSYRLLRAADGAIVYGQDLLTLPSDRSITAMDIPMAEGFLISVSCKAAVATTRGQTFVRLFLNPKVLGAGQPGLMMMSDYVTNAMAPGYPGGRGISPIEGPGWSNSFATVVPLAGNDWSWPVPTNARWRIMGIVSQLTTVAAAPVRVPILAVKDGAGNYVLFMEPNVGANAARAWSTSGAIGVPGSGVSGFVISWNLPRETILLPGWSISSATQNLAGADQWTAVRFIVEEWLDNV